MRGLRLGWALVPLLLAGGCLNFLETPMDRAAVESFIGAPLPPGAIDPQAYGEIALDTMVVARFELAAADAAQLDAFVAGMGLTEPFAEDTTPFYTTTVPYTEARRWWDVPETPAPGTTFSTISQEINGIAYRVLAVEDAAGQLTVYLQANNF